jgi:hypothetical protein
LLSLLITWSHAWQEWDLNFYQLEQIKRIRLLLRADGYYVQFLVNAENQVDIDLTGKMIGVDVGLKEFYTDSNGHAEPNPKFYRTSEKRLRFRQRRISRKKKGSANRKKAIRTYALTKCLYCVYLPRERSLFPKRAGLSKIAQALMGEKTLEPELSHRPLCATWKNTHFFC